MNCNHLKKAFTLVELLVVIAIIAILAGLLLPALEQARESAISLDCMTRMRAWGQAFKAYGDDFEQVYPSPAQDHRDTQRYPWPVQRWFRPGLVGDYIDTMAYISSTVGENYDQMGVGCPKVPKICTTQVGYGLFFEPPPGESGTRRNPVTGEMTASYAIMDQIACVFPSKVKSHSEKFLLVEAGANYFVVIHGVYYRGGYRFYDSTSLPITETVATTPNMAHNQGSNYLFFDGHVSWYPGFPPFNKIMVKMSDAYDLHEALLK